MANLLIIRITFLFFVSSFIFLLFFLSLFRFAHLLLKKRVRRRHFNRDITKLHHETVIKTISNSHYLATAINQFYHLHEIPYLNLSFWKGTKVNNTIFTFLNSWKFRSNNSISVGKKEDKMCLKWWTLRNNFQLAPTNY